MNFIKRHPRLSYLGVGVLLGVLSVLFTVQRYNTEIERIQALNDRIQSSSETVMAKLSLENESLRSEVQSLKSSTKIVEKEHADGSKERTYENDTESQSEVTEIKYQRQIALLEHSLETIKRELNYKLTLTEKSRPSASFSLGVTTELKPYVSGTYNFAGSWILQGYTIPYGTGEAGIGIGWQF